MGTDFLKLENSGVYYDIIFGEESIESLLSDEADIQVLGIHSDFIESLEEEEKYKCNNITEKIK